MSNDALNAVWDAAESGEFQALGTGPLFVAVVLADEGAAANRGEDWTCFPALKTIQKRTEMGRSTVERHLRALAEAGWISREPRLRENGAASSNLYTIHRDPGLRDALARARQAMISKGAIPTETVADLDCPHPNLGGSPRPDLRGSPRPDLRGSPRPDLGEAPSQIGGGDRPKSGDALLEPLSEPLSEPSARTACAAAAETSAQGFPRKLPLFPRGLFDQVRHATGGDPYRACDAYLRWCLWDETNRTIHPPSNVARAALERDLKRKLAEFNVIIGAALAGERQ